MSRRTSAQLIDSLQRRADAADSAAIQALEILRATQERYARGDDVQASILVDAAIVVLERYERLDEQAPQTALGGAQV